MDPTPQFSSKDYKPSNKLRVTTFVTSTFFFFVIWVNVFFRFLNAYQLVASELGFGTESFLDRSSNKLNDSLPYHLCHRPAMMVEYVSCGYARGRCVFGRVMSNGVFQNSRLKGVEEKEKLDGGGIEKSGAEWWMRRWPLGKNPKNGSKRVRDTGDWAIQERSPYKPKPI
uniref:Uncharacterized protein n=1 Tax=Brassica oleracea TaxID=3712 RepID=A0A3P6CFG0_BRAOL|nr:unnamed protein product [Brassica oleracea]